MRKRFIAISIPWSTRCALQAASQEQLLPAPALTAVRLDELIDRNAVFQILDTAENGIRISRKIPCAGYLSDVKDRSPYLFLV
jgi:hypothetical protein